MKLPACFVFLVYTYHGKQTCREITGKWFDCAIRTQFAKESLQSIGIHDIATIQFYKNEWTVC